MGTLRLRSAALATAVCLVLALTGCIASQSPAQTLSVSDGGGELLIFLSIQGAQLSQGEAWWADQAPELEVNVQDSVPDWETIILKNDVVIDRGPVMGQQQQAYAIWRSASAGVVANPGDTFEVLVVDHAEDRTVATFELSIET